MSETGKAPVIFFKSSTHTKLWSAVTERIVVAKRTLHATDFTE